MKHERLYRFLHRRKKQLILVVGLIFTWHLLTSQDTPETVQVQMICLTRNPVTPPISSSEGTWYMGDKVVDLPRRWCAQIQKHMTIYDESPPLFPYRRIAGFDVYHRHISQLPASYKIVENRTAFFLGNKYDFEPENFFHFVKQVYFPLHHLTKSYNRLRQGVENILFYPRIYAICNRDRYWYHDIKRYFYFNEILNVKNKLEISAHIDNPEPNQVCYKNAILSSEIFLDKAREATEYFKERIGVEDKCEPNILVIMDRTVNRRILNIAELEKVGNDLGYETRVVYMEKMTLKEQAQLIHCATVLAGVTGAGLQWAFFMRDHSRVIEIAWPHQDWPFFFAGPQAIKFMGITFKYYHSEEKDVVRPLKFTTVSNTTCRPNPKALNKYWEELFYQKGPFSDEDASAIVNDPRNYHFWSNTVTSLGKICDAEVEPESFRRALMLSNQE